MRSTAAAGSVAAADMYARRRASRVLGWSWNRTGGSCETTTVRRAASSPTMAAMASPTAEMGMQLGSTGILQDRAASEASGAVRQVGERRGAGETRAVCKQALIDFAGELRLPWQHQSARARKSVDEKAAAAAAADGRRRGAGSGAAGRAVGGHVRCRDSRGPVCAGSRGATARDRSEGAGDADGRALLATADSRAAERWTARTEPVAAAAGAHSTLSIDAHLP
jgi:hypothetical protein